ncbi:DNA-binding MarR family transcriptional regulator [Sphingomonas kyeonggiensis]|uniref:DNA-binding MarR family transcriptional regulator n=1 Tax=Sphingomonas kyeonggiensis TaxID=1268553 RepID=A0A7W7JX67_9SPHN|nr:MarR family winged helix-turn-helix transcriptional regulator [Sphingomonas kyeonggiensis]MBB4836996.1 DNA-binding MarR family transcriptional regulator [Sphingomonas kyeonggiensis]
MQKKESALVPTPPFSDAGLDTVPASWLLLGEQLNALLSASRAVTARMSDSFGADLQPAAFHVVQWLHAFGPAQASQVADALAMDRSATSRLVGQLRQAGLVESRAGTADRRSVILSLTEEGSRRMQAAIAYKGEVFRHRLEGWSETDIGHLTALLRRFNSDGING